MTGSSRRYAPEPGIASPRAWPSCGRRLRRLLAAVLLPIFVASTAAGVRAQPADGADATGVSAPAVMPAGHLPPVPGLPAITLATSIVSWTERPELPKALLPFTRNPVPIRYPRVSFAIGIGGFQSGFRGAEDAFRALEDSIRAGGYAVPSSKVQQSHGLFLMTLGVDFTPALEAALQFGQTSDPDNEVLLVGGLVSRRYTLPRAENVSLLAGLGVGAYGLQLKQRYGVVISPVDGIGGFTTLDFIQLKGDGRYGTLAGRLAVRAGPTVAFEALVQYFFMSELSMDAGSTGRMRVNPSGATLGVSFTVLF